ncbi:hypothetical protein [Flavihumibacter solisilvae]|nr:hypothetical protein [Flavihumibacter solisilvae]
MRKTYYIICLMAGLTAITGCKKDNSPATNGLLRVFNATPWTFYDCTVKLPGTQQDNPGANTHNFGPVEADAKTHYRQFSILYSYAAISLTMNNQTYTIQPIDYVGENPLKSGRYTYKLTYDSTNDQINLELLRD